MPTKGGRQRTEGARTRARARVIGAVRIGTSGYQYDHWRKLFYPADLAVKDWFAFYAREYQTVEINNTFYRLPAAHVFDAWAEAAPPKFCYALKFSRYGTHRKRLREPAQPIRLFTQRARRLGRSLGPILVQLPPRWNMNLERLRDFVARLPRDLRWSIEFRDASWLIDPVYDLLERHNVALCLHDMLPDHPQRVTADFVYLRFHGRRYAGSYSAARLRAYAQRIRGYSAAGLDVYAYFNNDQKGYAIKNSRDLKQYVRSADVRPAAARTAEAVDR